MKAKLIASILVLTTIISVGYPMASKATDLSETENSEFQIESSYNEENDDETINEEDNKEEVKVEGEESNSDLTEDVSSKETIEDNNVSSENQENVTAEDEDVPQISEGWNNFYNELHYFITGNDGVYEAISNAYVDGYYINENGVRTGNKVNTKVNSVSDAVSLMKIHDENYFNNSALDYFTIAEDKGYRVESIRNEFGISNTDLIDEPAYMVNLVNKETGEIEFRYATGCYTGKVYFGAYGFPKAYEVEYGNCLGEYSDNETYR